MHLRKSSSQPLSDLARNFNRDFTACHGRVTTGDQLSYLVESVCDENTSVQRGRGNLVLLDSLDAASGSFVPVAAALDQLAEKPAFAEPPPSYLSLETNDISRSVNPSYNVLSRGLITQAGLKSG